MESDKIENLLEKYFEGNTSIAEEKQLKVYFSSPNVAQHLEQYQSIFYFISTARKEQFHREIPIQRRRKKGNKAWLSIAASIVVLLGIGTYVYTNESNANAKNLGTFDNPQKAFEETQKALALLSNHVNTGIVSVQYIGEYEHSKNLIFKQ